ncbi:MAG: glycosyltransferase family 4 protein, partial [Proteobacteria bacterium]|nr:glycosyltransferase family 4 protein [Pseudomonadota bacterium]
PDWRLVLIGHELELHRNETEARQHRISFLKSMPNAEVARWVSRAAIFALPSRSDALPRVLMEAAAAGKARIGSAVDGIPRLITNEADGLLVPPKDPAALAAAIARLIDDPQLRSRLGSAARARVFRDFSTTRYIEDLQACIGRLFAHREYPADPTNERIRSGAQ